MSTPRPWCQQPADERRKITRAWQRVEFWNFVLYVTRPIRPKSGPANWLDDCIMRKLARALHDTQLPEQTIMEMLQR